MVRTTQHEFSNLKYYIAERSRGKEMNAKGGVETGEGIRSLNVDMGISMVAENE